MQSGGLLSGMLRSLLDRGTKLHTAIGYGQGSVIGFERLGTFLLAQNGVRVLAIYAETIDSLEGLIEVGTLASKLGKAVVLAVGGTSELGQLAAQSHTGSLASSRRVVEGVAWQHDMIMVSDVDELAWATEALVSCDLKRAPRPGVGIFAVSGGGGVQLADACAAAHVDLEQPGQETRTALSRISPNSVWNPYDAGAASLNSPEDFRALVDIFASDDQFGILVRIDGTGLPEIGEPRHANQCESFIEAVREKGKLPVLATGVSQDQRTLRRWAGVPVAAGVREAAVKLRALQSWSRPKPIPASLKLENSSNREIEMSTPLLAAGIISDLDATRVLKHLPVEWPHQVVVASVDEARDALATFSYPVVLKAGPGIAHRYSAGAVLLGLPNSKAALAGLSYLMARFGSPVSICESIHFESEYVLGYERSDQYGPLIMFGRGGSNVGEDVEFRAFPVSAEQAQALSERYRFPAPAGLLALIQALQQLTTVAAWIQTIDMNPIVVSSGGHIVALDAKVHTRSPGADAGGASLLQRVGIVG
jgi:acetyltransferase